jgi:hypothetical protein
MLLLLNLMIGASVPRTPELNCGSSIASLEVRR